MTHPGKSNGDRVFWCVCGGSSAVLLATGIIGALQHGTAGSVFIGVGAAGLGCLAGRAAT